MSPNDWPLFELQINTPSLRLFVPHDKHLDRLVDIAEAVHAQPGLEWWWEDFPGVNEYRAKALQNMWRARADWAPKNWTLHFAATDGKQIIGVQEIFAKDFPTLKSVETGSWIDPVLQGQGFGKEMRSAVLYFAFETLGAEETTTSAAVDNARSTGVTRSLGYESNGFKRAVLNGKRVDEEVFRMTRESWLERRRSDIEVQNFEPCRPFFF